MKVAPTARRGGNNGEVWAWGAYGVEFRIQSLIGATPPQLLT